jgi:hypothetical protein
VSPLAIPPRSFFFPQHTHLTPRPPPRRRELANQHDIIHGKAGSTDSLISDFAPKSDRIAAAATTRPVTLAVAESGATVQIQVADAAPAPPPARSILHNPACSGYFIEQVGRSAVSPSPSLTSGHGADGLDAAFPPAGRDLRQDFLSQSELQRQSGQLRLGGRPMRLRRMDFTRQSLIGPPRSIRSNKTFRTQGFCIHRSKVDEITS